MFSTIDPMAVLAFRIAWSMVFCLILIVLGKQTDVLKKVLKDKKQMLTLLAAGIVVSLNWGGYITAVMTGRVLDASLAYYMYPLFSIVIGSFVYGEKLRPLQWFAFALALIGVIVPMVAYGELPLFAIFIGVSFSIYGAIKKKVTVPGITSIFVETLWVAPIALAYLLLISDLSNITSFQWWMLPTTGIATSVPLILFAIGMKTMSLSLAGILMYINPTIQLLIGVFFYGEAFTKVHGIMFAFVWVGVALFLWDSLKYRGKEVTN
nr:EamA family transporter RarD [uncultured Peptoniphilus sp.]